MKEVVDKYFDFMKTLNGCFSNEAAVLKEMIDESRESKFEGTIVWKAIGSTITEEELKKLEKLFEKILPESYKLFLKYRHYIELQIGEVSFYRSVPNSIVRDAKRRLEGYYKELVSRGYIPIAELVDYGVLCFDTTSEKTMDYPLVRFDIEDIYRTPKSYARDFKHLFEILAIRLDNWIKNVKEKRHIINSE